MDLDDFDDGSAYALSSADECSPSDEEQGPELPGAELQIEGDFKYATSFLHPYHSTIVLTRSLSLAAWCRISGWPMIHPPQVS